MLDPFDARNLSRIRRAVSRAPSVHNNQPVKLRVVTNDRIELWASEDSPGHCLAHGRRATDQPGRELLISCGAALFNLRMAIRATGHDLAVWLLPDPDYEPSLVASAEIVTGRIRRTTAEEQELYDAVSRRRCYRGPFTSQRVPANILTTMRFAASAEGGYLRPLFPFQVTRWVRAAWQAEGMLARPSPNGARPPASPAPAEWAANATATKLLTRTRPAWDYSCNSCAGVPAERLGSRPQLLSLATDLDRPLDWLRTGQALQRAMLAATRFGVVGSLLSYPVELAGRNHSPGRWPGAWPFPETAQMLIRVGYPAQPAALPEEELPDLMDLRTGPAELVVPQPRLARAGLAGAGLAGAG